MTFYAIMILAMLLTLLLIPPLMRFASTIGAVDTPNERKVHARVTPRIGGIAIVLGALVPMSIWLPFDRQYLALLLSALVILAFGVWDDRKDISYRYKFLGQTIASLIVIFLGDISITYAPLMDGQALAPWVSVLLTLFCLLAVTNALNLADGLDGLAGGTTLLSFGLIAVLALNVEAADLLILTMAVIGGVLGFLRFNSHPASVFMGDTGSQFLGFILGVELILLTQNADIALSKASPVLILGLPLLDTLCVMGRRISKGRSPFAPDKQHIHHRLLALGFSHYETVVIIYLIQAVFIISAFFTAYSSDWLPIGLFLLYMLIIHRLFSYAESRGLQFSAPGFVRQLVSRQWIRVHTLVHNWPLDKYLPHYLFLLSVFLMVHLCLGINEMSADISLLAAMLALMFLLVALRKTANEWLDRLTTYTFSALLCYLAYVNDPGPMYWYLTEWVLVVLGGVWVFVAIMMQKYERFETTPLDILLVLLALLIPYFAGSAIELDHLPLQVVKYLVLLYLFEYAITRGLYRQLRLFPFTLAFGAAVISLVWLLAAPLV